jgi:hypothetical protein
MTSPGDDERPQRSGRRPLRHLPTVINVICGLAIARMALREPSYAVPLVAIVALLVVPRVVARRRMRRILLSGDVPSVLGTWRSTIEGTVFPETMAPLLAATAYAAYGWLDAARAALERAIRGPAWDAAFEQRLFIEALLDTFEGDRATALTKAEALERMPLPPAGLLARVRVTRLRRGVTALARAFAHRSLGSDLRALRLAASSTPLVHWAMRYGAAVVAIDRGDLREARRLLAHAPSWPAQSAFREFDAELRGVLTV